MELHCIRGGSLSELANKNYVIGVGISLGNKWFTPENIVELVQWALAHSKDDVIVYMADSIHALNIEARSGKNYERAKEVALKQGTEILEKVRTIIQF